MQYIEKDMVRNMIACLKEANDWNQKPFNDVKSCLSYLDNQINLMQPASTQLVTNYAELIWWEEWSPSTPDSPRECIAGGWKCSHCNVDLGVYLTEQGGEHCYFDRYEEKPTIEFCPCCGSRFIHRGD